MINHIFINGIVFALPDFPANSRVLLHLVGNSLHSASTLRNDEHVASIMTFLEIAEKLGIEIKTSQE